MSEENPQMSDWNGGLTRRQLRWLAEELRAADAAGEKVIVASHHQTGPGALWPSLRKLLAWHMWVSAWRAGGCVHLEGKRERVFA
jgi:hypothetical protein